MAASKPQETRRLPKKISPRLEKLQRLAFLHHDLNSHLAAANSYAQLLNARKRNLLTEETIGVISRIRGEVSEIEKHLDDATGSEKARRKGTPAKSINVTALEKEIAERAGRLVKLAEKLGTEKGKHEQIDTWVGRIQTASNNFKDSIKQAFSPSYAPFDVRQLLKEVFTQPNVPEEEVMIRGSDLDLKRALRNLKQNAKDAKATGVSAELEKRKTTRF
ncbi:hypothetical protein HZC09_01885 [Candidatus Micrarchaeota archaeon]|nr:hypothetical protein [Candidatus Micrarchaeota archaeon]